jgi:hypothetical protein
MIMLPLLVPVLLVTVMGARADHPLAVVNRFVDAHHRQINSALCLVFAALLLWSGSQGLR